MIATTRPATHHYADNSGEIVHLFMKYLTANRANNYSAGHIIASIGEKVPPFLLCYIEDKTSLIEAHFA